jgi:hypothetical protein
VGEIQLRAVSSGAGAVTSDFFFGCVHAFYDPVDGIVRNLYECA